MSLFSAPGQKPTQLELELFQQVPYPPVNHWDEIGQRLGLDALLTVLDALGGTKIESPPTRSSYIKRIWLPRRDEQIRTLRRQGTPVDTIARQFGVSEPTVFRVLAGKEAAAA